LPRLLVTLLAFATLVSFGACGTTPERWQFYRELLDADSLADDGEYEEAQRAYLVLAPAADRDDLLLYIRYRVALMEEMAGNYELAIAGYRQIWETPYNLYDDNAGKALFRTAEIVRDVYDDQDGAVELFETLIETFPNTVSADDALFELIAYWRARGESRRLVEYIGQHYVALQRSEIADNFVYWSARLLQDDLGDCSAALSLYEVVIVNFHPSGFVDDSVWRSGLCHRTLGEIDAEYTLLSAFIDAREVSWIMADYESEYYKPSLFRMAEIHEERGELDEAIGVLERFQGMYRLSLDRDDTQYRIMEMQMELADIDGMRGSLRWLEREYPDSRYIVRAEALLEEATGR
jgi:tetratricopeptide (TPR) repeat protein